MNAPMLGMTMFDNAVPNFWAPTRMPPRGAASVELSASDMCVASDSDTHSDTSHSYYTHKRAQMQENHHERAEVEVDLCPNGR
ncbi:hypothetical protein GCM10022231_29250 [Gordonia caeni]|uniref:Uncharacterized protein n=1 Tax=Gordonia caeni TaxID=1007097 RepID=A0ABP7PJB9_9ACTN